MCKIKFFLCFRQTFIYNNILKSIKMADFLPFIKRFRIKEKKYLPKSLQI